MKICNQHSKPQTTNNTSHTNNYNCPTHHSHHYTSRFTKIRENIHNENKPNSRQNGETGFKHGSCTHLHQQQTNPIVSNTCYVSNHTKDSKNPSCHSECRCSLDGYQSSGVLSADEKDQILSPEASTDSGLPDSDVCTVQSWGEEPCLYSSDQDSIVCKHQLYCREKTGFTDSCTSSTFLDDSTEPVVSEYTEFLHYTEWGKLLVKSYLSFLHID